MFYSYDLLIKDGGSFCLAWKLANIRSGVGIRVPRSVLMEQDVEKLSTLLISLTPVRAEGAKQASSKFSLYLLSKLMFGVAMINAKKMELLLRETDDVIKKLKNRSIADVEVPHKKKREKKRNLTLAIDDEVHFTQNDVDALGPQASFSASVVNLEDITLEDNANYQMLQTLIFQDTPQFQELNDFERTEKTFIDSRTTTEKSGGSIEVAEPIIKKNTEEENLALEAMAVSIAVDDPYLVENELLEPLHSPLNNPEPVQEAQTPIPDVQELVETPGVRSVQRATTTSPKRISSQKTPIVQSTTPVDPKKAKKPRTEELEELILDSLQESQLPPPAKKAKSRKKAIYQDLPPIDEDAEVNLNPKMMTRAKKDVLVRIADPNQLAADFLRSTIPATLRKNFNKEFLTLWSTAGYRPCQVDFDVSSISTRSGTPEIESEEYEFLKAIIERPNESEDYEFLKSIIERPREPEDLLFYRSDLISEIEPTLQFDPLQEPEFLIEPEFNETLRGENLRRSDIYERVEPMKLTDDYVKPSVLDEERIYGTMEDTSAELIKNTDLVSVDFIGTEKIVQIYLREKIDEASPYWLSMDSVAVKHETSRKRAALLFNSLLGMLKDGEIEVQQDEPFGEIFVRRPETPQQSDESNRTIGMQSSIGNSSLTI